MLSVNPKIFLLDWITFIIWLILMLSLPFFSSGMKSMWLFDAFYNFEDVVYSSPFSFISFMPFLDYFCLSLTWEGSMEMVEVEVVLDKWDLGRLKKDPLGDPVHITINFLNMWILNTRNLHDFKFKFYVVPIRLCRPWQGWFFDPKI